MLKLLVKKQLTEIFRSYFYNAKKNTARSKAATVALFLLFTFLMAGVIGVTFAFLAKVLCRPLTLVGVDWLYFTVFGGIAIVLGTLGSVFNTFSGLYLGKDNDLLLSMPIPLRYIVAARLLGVYLMGLLYSGIIAVPTLIVYWITVGPTVPNVLGGLVWMLLISLLILALTCLLGWVVARLSVKLKNKSFVTVLIALVGVVLYYVIYFKAQSMIRDLIHNAALYGSRIKGAAWLLYSFGKGGTGDWLHLLLFAGLMAVFLGLVWWMLNRTFLNIATATGTVSKRRTAARQIKPASLQTALLGKEFRRFASSANYMLNCGLGVVLIPAIGIAALIFSSDLRLLFALPFFGRGAMTVVCCTLLAGSCTMIIPAVPSVSLEARTLWLIKSLPVTPMQVLRPKLLVQLILGGAATVFAAACLLIALPFGWAEGLLLMAFAVSFVLSFGMASVSLGLRLPNLTWTNEIVPIKQSGAVLIAVLGGFAYTAVFAGLFFLVKPDPTLYLTLAILLNLLLAAALYVWLKKCGVKRFEAL